jgi:hypothetical protein
MSSPSGLQIGPTTPKSKVEMDAFEPSVADVKKTQMEDSVSPLPNEGLWRLLSQELRKPRPCVMATYSLRLFDTKTVETGADTGLVVVVVNAE